MDDFWQLPLFWTALYGCSTDGFCAISHQSNFYNVTPNVNKKFLQIAPLEPTPYRIKMPVSFLEDLTHITFNNSIKQNQQQASKVD